jgi:hypothetical protein
MVHQSQPHDNDKDKQKKNTNKPEAKYYLQEEE